ncbi:hypothetical protein ACJJIU_13215 [Microbulbifer sp. CnH-101-E]|uniref:hypothetical protein n=1 Tax=unclassified Microbulbifer TaxID=2619833 RepID=UPI0040393840
MVFSLVNLSGSGQPKLAGREQVGRSERASYNQARQDRPAGCWAGQPTLRFASAALAGNVMALGALL